MMANHNLARAVRFALIAAGAASAGVTSSGAHAQDQELEQIVVTGSRIARPDFETASPVVSLSAESFQETGIINAEQLVNTLPQVVPSFSSGNNNPGGGQAYINLRGLGSERNLVLVDGKRLTPGDSVGRVDINTIPTALIERIEVLSGGASAVYGSDAIAGAVNFILKKNFNGIEFGGQYGISEEGDADNGAIDVTMGSDLADGKGNIVIFASYDTREELTKGDREFSQQATSATSFFPTGRFAFTGTNLPTQAAVNSLFSSYGVTGAVNRSGSFGFNDDGSLFAVGAAGATYDVQNFKGDPSLIATNFYPDFFSYNFEPFNKLIIPQNRFSLGTQGSLAINDKVEAYTRILFTNYNSETALAPSPAPTGTNITFPAAGANFTLPVSNPFVKANAGLMSLLNTRTGDSAGAPGVGANEDILYRYRFNSNGPRVESYERDTYQFVLGFRGDITDKWSYDAYGATGKYNEMLNQDGNVSVTRVERLLDAPDGGVSICEGGFNPFGYGNRLSKECADYVGVLAKNTTEIEQNLAEAVVSGDLFDLPAGGVTAAFGVFWQEQSYTYLADEILASGDVAGFNAQDNVIGRVSNTDLFTEFYVPLLKDLPGVQQLGLSLGYRYSDHSNSGGNSSYKAEIDWNVVGGVRVRGGYQRAVRAPNIGELFQPQFEDNPDVADPCNFNSTFRTGPDGAQVRALCIAQGIAPAVIDSYQQGTSQIGALAGGNPDLQEETADTYTLGVVWQPEFVDRLNISVDYYNIEVSDVISAISPDIVVNRCFNSEGTNPSYSSNNFYCNLFVRDALGGIDELQETQNNLAKYATDGVDLQADYRFPIGGYGDIGVNWVATWVNKFEVTNLPGDDPIDYVGSIGDDPGDALPDFKTTLTLSWALGDFSTSLRARYLPSMIHEATIDDGCKTDKECGYKGADSITYLDLSGAWQITDGIQVRLGVDNLTNEDPVLIDPDVDSGTDPSTYDVIGRKYFVNATWKF
jgi:outer membrane receptor protein involved in Fe transport